MAQQPHRPAAPSRPAPPQPSRHEPPRHPAQPQAARPGVAQRDQQPRPDEPDQPPPEEKVVDPAEAGQLFRAGHRLKRKGDPPDKWFAAFRLHNTLVICYPMDEEIEKNVLDQELVLADDPPGQSGGTPIYNPPL
jgi:hypothetical protein